MSLKEKLRSFFNRDIEYIDEYIEDDFSFGNIEEDIRVVIAVSVAAFASDDSDANYKIKSIKRVR